MSIHYENSRPCCPKCKHKGYKALPYDPEKTKVVFECGHCNFKWNAGARGGEYVHFCQNVAEAKESGDLYWHRRESPHDSNKEKNFKERER